VDEIDVAQYIDSSQAVVSTVM